MGRNAKKLKKDKFVLNLTQNRPFAKKISREKEMITLTLILTIFIVASIIVAELSVPTFLVFLVLKLVGVIAWSWFWVCFPLILGVVFLVLWIALKTWADVID